MAGIELDVRINQDFLRRWHVFKREIKPNNLLKVVGQAWVREINQTFRKEGRRGERWLPLADSTIKRRRKGKGRGRDKILQDTGTLRSSFNPFKTGSAWRVGNKFVRVGSNIHYASHHDEGGRSKTGKPMPPQRPIIPSERVAREIADKVLAAMIRKAAKKVNR